jgi:hypothetical protein
LVVAGAAVALGATPERDINIVADLTDAGRQVARPSRDHPVYFVPVVVGFQEGGDLHAGDKSPPPKSAVLLKLTQALAAQGYLSVGAKTPEPSLLLTFSWGALNPATEYSQVEVPSLDPDQAPTTTEVKSVANAPVMAALVAGNTRRNLPQVPAHMTNVDLDAIREAMSDDRYFVTLVAFDWPSVKAHRKVILWSTKMSVRAQGLTLAEVVPALIKSGEAFFGRETLRPEHLAMPVTPEGRVEVGTPRVVTNPPAQEGERK